MAVPVDAYHVAADSVTPPIAVTLAAERKKEARCRTNSRRGATDSAQRSYPSVQAVCRALDPRHGCCKSRRR